jgi:hypothetical protein
MSWKIGYHHYRLWDGQSLATHLKNKFMCLTRFFLNGKIAIHVLFAKLEMTQM